VNDVVFECGVVCLVDGMENSRKDDDIQEITSLALSGKREETVRREVQVAGISRVLVRLVPQFQTWKNEMHSLQFWKRPVGETKVTH